jgi:hypothetical protein
MSFKMTAPIQSIERSKELDQAVEFFLSYLKTGLFQFQSTDYEERYLKVKEFFQSLGCVKDEANTACRMTSDEWDSREDNDELPISFFNNLKRSE